MEKKISGWGNNKFAYSKVYFPKNLSELKKFIRKKTIARGLGRSYGDSSIQPNGTIITTKLNKIISFNQKSGILEAEAGISIEDILNLVVEKGWFLPVTPGSKQITLGGMVASNVHGKNHHKDGSFKNHIINFKIINNKKRLLTCSKRLNKKLFDYTIGGMGLSGIIYSCKFKLKKIRSNIIIQEKIRNINLKKTITSIKKSQSWDYNVAWIDTSADINQLGRSILTRGKFSNKDNFEQRSNKKIFVPKIFPSWFMSSLFIKILNNIYFYFSNSKKTKIGIDNFFYPLDKISNWNTAYGRKGFISYQCLIPHKNSYRIINKILTEIKVNKIYSFVSVLKSMGKKDGYLSFGAPGYTMVFDFPLYKNINDILNKIDKIVLSCGGRVYLTKDSRIDKNNFKKINKEFNNIEFKNFRKKSNYFFDSLQSKRLEI